jgi:hypothetical protein
MLDANQVHFECYNKLNVKPFTIKWLRLPHGLDDPFLHLMGQRPNSTPKTANHEIDYVLTFGIDVTNISTMDLNFLAASDHQGIIFDLNLASHFSSSYSDVSAIPGHLLTSGNKRLVDSYLAYAHKQIEYHKIWDRLHDLHHIAIQDPSSFSGSHGHALNTIDNQLTEIMLSAECQCSKSRINKLPWSPVQQAHAQTYSY